MADKILTTEDANLSEQIEEILERTSFEVTDKVIGGVKISKPKNIDGQFVYFTPIDAGEETVVRHTMGRIPIALRLIGADTITISSGTIWNEQRISFVCQWTEESPGEVSVLLI